MEFDREFLYYLEQLKKDNPNLLEEFVLEYLTRLDVIFPTLSQNIPLITKLASLYINCFSSISLDESAYLKYEDMDIFTTLELVKKFLSMLDEDYLAEFDRCLSDGTITFLYNNKSDSVCQEAGDNIDVNVSINYTVLDGCNLIHEFFHYLNSNPNISESRELFTEYISIYFESLYMIFLVRMGYSKNVIRNEILLRIDDSLNYAYLVLMAGAVLDSYLNTGNINTRSIIFLDIYRKSYKEFLQDISDLKKGDCFFETVANFDESVGYFIGYLLTFHSLKDLSLGTIKCLYINKNVNDISIEEIMHTLNVDDSNFKYLILDAIEALSDVFKVHFDEDKLSNILGISVEEIRKYLDDSEGSFGGLYGSDNSYSGAYRSGKNKVKRKLIENTKRRNNKC